jgi:hypothetical protein
MLRALYAVGSQMIRVLDEGFCARRGNKKSPREREREWKGREIFLLPKCFLFF